MNMSLNLERNQIFVILFIQYFVHSFHNMYAEFSSENLIFEYDKANYFHVSQAIVYQERSYSVLHIDGVY